MLWSARRVNRLYFQGVTLRAGLGRFIAAIGSLLREPVFCQALQAGAIFQRGRAADWPCEHQTMQGGAAAGFQVGLIPHRPALARIGVKRKP